MFSVGEKCWVLANPPKDIDGTNRARGFADRPRVADGSKQKARREIAKEKRILKLSCRQD